MKTFGAIVNNAQEMESIISVCCGNPQGDELPQVAGEEDILIDAYSDIMNVPREHASARMHHQYNDDALLDDGYIH